MAERKRMDERFGPSEVSTSLHWRLQRLEMRIEALQGRLAALRAESDPDHPTSAQCREKEDLEGAVAEVENQWLNLFERKTSYDMLWDLWREGRE